MIIHLVRVGFDGFQTEIFHICKLFFEEVELLEEDPEGRAELTLSVELHNDGITAGARTRMRHKVDALEWSSAFERELRPDAPPDMRKRTLKRMIGYTVLSVLRDATGLEQPWGILTGVRPTKLMHQLRQTRQTEEVEQLLREEYLVTETKIKLLTDIADRQLRVIPDFFDINRREVSIYIGIPFCPTKCAYCTFPAYDIRGQNGSVEAFLTGLHYEIRETGAWLKRTGLGVTTIYWGGGTPTSIEADQMDALFVTMKEAFPDLSQVRELTVEAGRPDTITPEKIEVMKKWKVDRISINPQSFTQQTLDAIGRHHTVTETVEKFKLAREMGLNNINMDLIIGLPNEGKPEFEHTLAETAKLLPESLTVHTLSFKRASRMTQNRDQYEVAERSEVEEMMDRATDWTRQHGYVPYYMYRQKNILGNLENVGYSLPGKESLYNILMMEDNQTIIGLGCGAVSKVLYPGEVDVATGEERQRIERFPNPKEPSVYNTSYKEYIAKKMTMLDEAYGFVRT